MSAEQLKRLKQLIERYASALVSPRTSGKYRGRKRDALFSAIDELDRTPAQQGGEVAQWAVVDTDGCISTFDSERSARGFAKEFGGTVRPLVYGDAVQPVCKCDMRTKLVGDGCHVCNPELAADLPDEVQPVGAVDDVKTELETIIVLAKGISERLDRTEFFDDSFPGLPNGLIYDAAARATRITSAGTRLLAALAAAPTPPAAEPVAWQYRNPGINAGVWNECSKGRFDEIAAIGNPCNELRELYTHPPASPADPECPEVRSYDPQGTRRTMTCWFPDGEYVHYARCDPDAASPADAVDAARLDWMDRNLRFRMGWKVGQAPAGNVSISSVIFLGDKEPTPIRAAIDAAMAQAGSGHG